MSRHVSNYYKVYYNATIYIIHSCHRRRVIIWRKSLNTAHKHARAHAGRCNGVPGKAGSAGWSLIIPKCDWSKTIVVWPNVISGDSK